MTRYRIHIGLLLLLAAALPLCLRAVQSPPPPEPERCALRALESHPRPDPALLPLRTRTVLPAVQVVNRPGGASGLAGTQALGSNLPGPVDRCPGAHRSQGAPPHLPKRLQPYASCVPPPFAA